MTESHTKSDIEALLKNSLPFDDFILFRDSEEADFLREFTCARNPHGPGEKASAACVEPEASLNSLEKIREAIESCCVCGDNTEKKFGVGDGSSGIMVILNAPLLMSDAERNLYRDDSIRLMKKMVESIQVPFARCYTTNLVKCRPLSPVIKPSEKVHNCLPMIGKEIGIVKPSIIIVMGDILPLQSLVHDSRGIFWYSVEHPVTILKNPEMKRKAWNTLQAVILKKQELGLK